MVEAGRLSKSTESYIDQIRQAKLETFDDMPILYRMEGKHLNLTLIDNGNYENL